MGVRIPLAVDEAPDAALPLIERIAVLDAWVVNTYRACDVRCRYCITAAQGVSTPRFDRSAVSQQLELELDAIGAIDRLVVGSYCDVYPSVESDLRVTRAALEVLRERAFRYVLVTKGPTVLRDVDLFEACCIEVSLCSVDENVVRRLEPGAASPSARIETIHGLAAAGVHVIVQASPFIPGVTDVLALRERIDPSITINVTPLRLPDYLQHFARAQGLTQRDVNDAYRREYDCVGSRDNITWSRLPPLDGRGMHIRDNLGRPKINDWSEGKANSPMAARLPYWTPSDSDPHI